MRQGSFPPPALPGFIGTASPSAICLGRPRPSRASRCRSEATRSAPLQTSLVAHKSSRVRVVTTTPAERSGAYLARLPDHGGLPQTLWQVGFRGDLFGACTVFTLVTARTLRCPPYRGIFLKCFRPFVASWPAPSASGRSESGRVGISPTGLVHLRQGTHNALCRKSALHSGAKSVRPKAAAPDRSDRCAGAWAVSRRGDRAAGLARDRAASHSAGGFRRVRNWAESPPTKPRGRLDPC